MIPRMRRLALLFVMSLATVCALAQTKVVGHRGARHQGAPYENTLEALRFAQEEGVDAVEFDINLSSDDKVVVVHGPRIPGSDVPVTRRRFRALRRAQLPGNTRIPTLEEWFRQCLQRPEIPVVLEVKRQSSAWKETLAVEKAMALARKMGLGRQLQWTTFSTWAASEIKRLDPDAKVLFLAGKRDACPSVEWAKACGYELSLAVDLWKKHPDLLGACKALGVETTIWIVNDEAGIDWVLEQGFDYVSTDMPEKIKPYVDRRLSRRTGS